MKAELLNELAVNRDVVADPSTRVRFYGMLVACCRDLGDFAGGLRAFEIARKIDGSPAARAELLAQGASLHIERRDADAAIASIEAALKLVQGELELSRREESQPPQRWRNLLTTKAWVLAVRAEITLHLKAGSLRQAMADVLEALALTHHKAALRVRMAAITLLTSLLTRFGTFSAVSEALRLLDLADQELARRRFRRSDGHRVRIRWGKALALARLGMVDRAEQIMTEVAETLMQAGARQAAENAVEALIWIVEERAGQAGRAKYLNRRYRARLDESVEP